VQRAAGRVDYDCNTTAAETVNATLDESTLDAAVGWIERRFPGNPEDSLRRAVALVYRAILTLLAEPRYGHLSEPSKVSASGRGPREEGARSLAEPSKAAVHRPD